MKKMEEQQGTTAYLRAKGKTVYVLSTQKAVEKYQELTAQGEKIVMLLHLTC